MSTAAADTINATAVNVIETLRGDVNQIFQLVARPVGDFVRVFDLDADEFVGRQAVFDQLDAFVGQYRAGYFEIVGAAGLGKTALASEIARRHDAVAFFASAGNTHRPDQFLEHVSAALIVRHGLSYATLPVRAGDARRSSARSCVSRWSAPTGRSGWWSMRSMRPTRRRPGRTRCCCRPGCRPASTWW